MERVGRAGCLIAIFAALGIIPFVLLSSWVGILFCMGLAFSAGTIGIIVEQVSGMRRTPKQPNNRK